MVSRVILGLTLLFAVASSETVYDVLKKTTDASNFANFVDKHADLKDILVNGTDVTVFVPDNKFVDGSVTKGIAEYHIVLERIAVEDLKGDRFHKTACTDNATVNLGEGVAQVLEIIDGKIKIRNQYVDEYVIDINSIVPLNATNGFVYHKITNKILPPDYGIAKFLEMASVKKEVMCTEIVSRVNAAGLKSTLDTSAGITLFAPTNAAFVAAKSFLDRLDKNKILDKFLRNHVVLGVYYAKDLAAQTLTSLDGGAIVTSVDANGTVSVNGMELNMDLSNYKTMNGVVHFFAGAGSVLVPEVAADVKDALLLNPALSSAVDAIQDNFAAEFTLLTANGTSVIMPTNNAVANSNGTWNPSDATATAAQLKYWGFSAASVDLLDGKAHVIETMADPTAALGNKSQVIIAQKSAAAANAAGDMYTFNGISAAIAETTDSGSVYQLNGVLAVPKDIATVATEAGLNTFLALVVNDTAILAAATSPAVTVFAPVDAAFVAAGLTAESPNLQDILKRHVVLGNIFYSPVLPASVTTAEGISLDVTTRDGSVFIGGVKVLIADVLTTNGVVHVLEGVLPGSNPPSPDDGSSGGLAAWGWVLIILAVLLVLGVAGYVFYQRKQRAEQSTDMPYTAA